MVRAGIIGAALAMTLALGAGAETRPRAASISVCTDQFLLALADADQVAAVSWQAAGERSPVRDLAQGIPSTRGMAEELLVLGADITLFDPYGHPRTAGQLERLDVDVVRIGSMGSLDDVEAEILRLGTILHRDNEARALVQDLESRRAHLATRQGDLETAPRALYVTPGGGGAGAGTFVHEVMELGGFRNLQADLGYQGWGRVPLEELIANPPDVLILSFFETADPSLLDNFARHPLYREILQNTPQIHVPAAPWVCAGPYLLNAAEQLADEREQRFVPRQVSAR